MSLLDFADKNPGWTFIYLIAICVTIVLIVDIIETIFRNRRR